MKILLEVNYRSFYWNSFHFVNDLPDGCHKCPLKKENSHKSQIIQSKRTSKNGSIKSSLNPRPGVLEFWLKSRHIEEFQRKSEFK